MRAEDVDTVVARAVERALEHGAQPARVLLGVPAYQALVSRDGLAPRSIGKHACTSLRALVHGFDLPIDCYKAVEDDDALCKFIPMELGVA